MRSVINIAILVLMLCSITAVHSDPAPTRGPERTGKIAKIVLATEAEKKEGILATITIKDKDAELFVQVTTDTKLWISKGKLGDIAKPSDFQVGEPVSVWFKKDDKGKIRTEQVMSFRAGVPDVP
jgi:hypothetical protein